MCCVREHINNTRRGASISMLIHEYAGIPGEGAGVAGHVHNSPRPGNVDPVHELKGAAACGIEEHAVPLLPQPAFLAGNRTQVGLAKAGIGKAIYFRIRGGRIDEQSVSLDPEDGAGTPGQRQREIADATEQVENPVLGLGSQQFDCRVHHLAIDVAVYLYEADWIELDADIELRKLVIERLY